MLRAPRSQSELKIVALGDTGTGKEPQKIVAQAIAKKCAGKCRFGLLLGDLFYPTGVSGARDPQFKTKFAQVYHFLGFPFYIVMGNHDYGGYGGGFEFKKANYYLNYAKRDRYFIFPTRKSYYFHRGPATFLALNTQEILYRYDYREHVRVVRKALREAAKRKSSWIIAFGHHTYISNAKHGNAGNYEGLPHRVRFMSGHSFKEFFDRELCHKIDLYISGHDHNRQLLKEKCGVLFAISGAGATLRPITDPERNPALFQKSSLGFLLLDITPSSLSLQFVDKSAKVEFEKVLKKHSKNISNK